MGLLRTLLIILLVYYGIKILTKLLAPYFIGYMSKKMQDKFGGNQPYNNTTTQPKQNVGETVIDKVPQQDKATNDKVGEYVDFEEIEE